MVNIKNNSVELSIDKFKSLITALSVFDSSKMNRISVIVDALKDRQSALQSKIEYLNKLNEGLGLNNNKENEETNFLYFFLDCCQQSYDLISFILENINHVTVAATVCKAPVNQNSVDINALRANLPLLNNYVLSLQKIDILNKFAVVRIQSIKNHSEKFYKQLIKRHTLDNIKIYHNIFVTDFCLLFLNASQKEDNFKLKLIQNILKNKIIFFYLKDSKTFDSDLENLFVFITDMIDSLQKEFSTDIFEVKNVVGSTYGGQEIKSHHVNILINQIKNLSFNNVEYQNNDLFVDQKINYKSINSFIESGFKHLLNESLTSAEVYSALASEAEKCQAINSTSGFYTCKISSGSPDGKEGGQGALELVPAEKPNVTLDHIVGSGFEEIKNFISAVKFTSQWSDLFLATSPSKTTDKSNVLLVGPPGCGKTEILRAVASDKESISVFAQGSDFLTCWRGEAEKNPKRLFEEGVKLQKKSKKNVYFLIDEIDSVLSSNNKPGEVNLSLEFQVLMDGVINYSGLSVWGATNFLDRIPPAMVRRFSRVEIVGELNQQQRITLLKHFINFVPCKDFDESSWEQAATKLNGATGNVIRKIADFVWRDRMTDFVNKYPDQASELVKWLNQYGKFDINQFSQENKEELKSRLSNYTSVNPEYLNGVIDSHLKNLAFRSEIQVAVNTYEVAKKILNQL